MHTKIRKNARRLTALLLAAALCLGLIPISATGESASFEKVTSETEFTTGEYYMLASSAEDTSENEGAYAPGVLDGTWITAVEASDAPDNAVWTLTVEENTVTLQDSNGSFVAPKGGNTNGISEGEYEWTWTFSDGKFRFYGQGEDTVVLAGNSGSENKFRAYKTATADGNPNGYPSSFTLYKKASSGGSATETVAAPQADPKAGSVPSGTEITLTSSTAGAQIFYTLNGEDPSGETGDQEFLYSEDEKPVIEGSANSVTLKAIAVKDDKQSAVQTLTYTIAEEESALPLKDGDRVVIYAPAYGKALSSEKTGFYNVGTDITVEEDGTLTGYTDSDIWTVIDNEDGTFSFSQDGQNIGLEDSYASMNLGAAHDDWEIISLGDGLYNIQNTGRGNYMEWYAQYSNWSTYNSGSAATDDQFRLAFYLVPEGTVTDPDEPDTPAVEGLNVVASPVSGASVKDGDIIELSAASGAEIYYTADGSEPAAGTGTKYEDALLVGSDGIPAPTDGKSLTIKAVAYIPASQDAEAQTGPVCTFTYKAPVSIDGYQLYFGQLHAHTSLSDGTGTVGQAFDHAAGVENLDFLALTDHSNSFEGQSGLPSAGTTHLGDANAEEVNASWREGREGARAITERENGTFIGLYGFEMTWSGGAPGHINTFNSNGFENRNVEPYRKGDNYDVLQAYFDTLNENPQTISQFNHPGDTFGDFMDFALYSPVTDQQMTLIEVGNGEGAVGASGYFPSYEYYTRALDKGWHVAPTNNQDNHKGNWGDSNTARSVVLTSDLSEASIYDAMKNYRVYATEDNDLSILYTLNGNVMGSILGEQDNISIEAEISDPTDSGETKVEVIVNGGLSAATKTLDSGSGSVTFDLPANYSYYYLRITQADKHIAVTAPVWVGESINAGITGTESDVALPIKGDTININSQIYNNSGEEMSVTSLTYTTEGETSPLRTASSEDLKAINASLASGNSADYTFAYEAVRAGGFNINVSMQASVGGETYTFTDVLKLSISDPSVATKVLIDGTHYNDYVNGYYSGNMTNFINMGIEDNIQVRIVQPGETVTKDMLQDVSLFVISAPLKYTSDYTGEAEVSTFEEPFIETVRDYVSGGGTVVVCGLADYQDSNSGLPYTSYEQANSLLEGIGSSMRINDDELIDQDDNGGQPYRLYFDDFNYGSSDPVVSAILNGVAESGLRYSSYSGCSVSVGEGEAIVFGHDTTYSINSKAPAQGHDKPVLSYSAPYDEDTAVVTKGNVVSLATEQVGSGRVYAAGTVFLSNFEVASEDKDSYANAIIARNLLSGAKSEPEISSIQEARAGEDGQVFTVRGTVAAGSYESENSFFNCIYIQDEDGNGINVFPVDDSDIRRGDQVQVTGSISSYIGDKQLSAISVEVLDEPSREVVITDVTTAQAADYDTNFGKLVRVTGTVESSTLAGGLVESITLKDDSGESCRVFIDGYIGYSDSSSDILEDFVKEGASVTAIGFVSHDAEGNRLRVRDRSEITPAAETPDEPSGGSGDSGGSAGTSYDISVSAGSSDHGNIDISPSRAAAGRTVTLTVTPDDGYVLNTLTVTDNDGEELELTKKDDGTYTFVMPKGKVTVSASFTKESSDMPGETPGGEPGQTPGETPSSLPFTDVSSSDWFCGSVEYVFENGLMNGVSESSFDPDSNLTRSMITQILYNLEDRPSVSDSASDIYTDVASASWYADAVGWATSCGIVNGYGNGVFGPEDPVTREQMAAILYNYAVFKGYDTTFGTDPLAGFLDSSDVSGWAADAMNWSVSSGLISGKGGGILDPSGTATRAEVAAIFARFCEQIPLRQDPSL